MSPETDTRTAPSAALLAQHTLNPVQARFLACRALFSAFAGLVYSLQADEQDGHLRTAPAGMRFARVIGGVDWGYTNPTAAAVFGLDGDERAWQLDEWVRRHAPLEGVVLPALVELT